MRLATIDTLKKYQATVIPEVNREDISGQIGTEFKLYPRDRLASIIKRQIGPVLLRLQRQKVQAKIGCALPLPFNDIGIEDRFLYEAAQRRLLKNVKSFNAKSVLVGGCYIAGEEVQFWLRRNVAKCVGVDINCLNDAWARLLPVLHKQYKSELDFQLSPLEKMDLPANSVDVVTTTAVLEHVGSLAKVAEETARVLRPGGIAIHAFGPLYFTFGGDHCISSYGEDCGFDHLLLSEEEYSDKINNQAFFDTQSDPNLPFWARRKQFSLLTALEYDQIFREYFDVLYCNAVVSAEALRFRANYPEKWARLLSSGIQESDLLIKTINVVLKVKK